jgi:hypothetical protein
MTKTAAAANNEGDDKHGRNRVDGGCSLARMPGAQR